MSIQRRALTKSTAGTYILKETRGTWILRCSPKELNYSEKVEFRRIKVLSEIWI
ncbi:hypothetical protein DPMN_128854 [Dreissena polymorpha]|uniref:Uncharacterized protein n=1 Tax=Dreissena polymorpha TaxID=45954 RepID=A0A9D4K009_DREPO|nr:hypothetical protein DPMN_128854 [Dreissena polymorpha]